MTETPGEYIIYSRTKSALRKYARGGHFISALCPGICETSCQS